MLGVSFSELVIACGVAFLVMKPRDLRRVAYWYRCVLKSFMELKGIAQDTIDGINKDWEEDEGKSTNYVIDTDTAAHKVYDADPLDIKKPLN